MQRGRWINFPGVSEFGFIFYNGCYLFKRRLLAYLCLRLARLIYSVLTDNTTNTAKMPGQEFQEAVKSSKQLTSKPNQDELLLVCPPLPAHT